MSLTSGSSQAGLARPLGLRCTMLKSSIRSWPIAAITRPAPSFDEAFRLHRFLHLGPGGHARLESLDVRPLREIDLVHAGPVEDREKVGVGDAELAAARVLLSLEPL